MPQRIYALPDQDDIFARVVEAVPHDWSDVSGSLEPTDEIRARSPVAQDTGFECSQSCAVRIEARADRDARPDPVALILHGQLPAFVSFDHVGHGADWQFRVARDIALGYVRRGYRGHLFFTNGRDRAYAHQHPAVLDLYLRGWSHRGQIGGPSTAMPPSAVLRWDPRYGGRLEQLDAIERVCRSLGREFDVAGSP